MKISTKRLLQAIGAVASVISIAIFISQVGKIIPTWVVLLVVIANFAILVVIFPRTQHILKCKIKWFHEKFVLFEPWFVLLILGLIAYPKVTSLFRHGPIILKFDHTTCALFNSWSKPETGDLKRIVVYTTKTIEGVPQEDRVHWDISYDKRIGTFNYRVDYKESESISASSGGYMTFYDRKDCSLEEFRKVKFQFKAKIASGNADVGVRLAFDPPAPNPQQHFLV